MARTRITGQDQENMFPCHVLYNMISGKILIFGTEMNRGTATPQKPPWIQYESSPAKRQEKVVHENTPSTNVPGELPYKADCISVPLSGQGNVFQMQPDCMYTQVQPSGQQ